jgi:hypothetical protein
MLAPQVTHVERFNSYLSKPQPQLEHIVKAIVQGMIAQQPDVWLQISQPHDPSHPPTTPQFYPVIARNTEYEAKNLRYMTPLPRQMQTHPAATGQDPIPHGVFRRSQLDTRHFNHYFGLPKDLQPGYPNTPFFRPSPNHPPGIPPSAHVPAPAATANTKANKSNKNAQAAHAALREALTISQQIEQIRTDQTDGFTGALSVRSLVRMIDAHCVSYDPYLYSGRPVSLEQGWKVVDNLYDEESIHVHGVRRPSLPNSTSSGQSSNTAYQTQSNLLALQPGHHFYTPYINKNSVLHFHFSLAINNSSRPSTLHSSHNSNKFNTTPLKQSNQKQQQSLNTSKFTVVNN